MKSKTTNYIAGAALVIAILALLISFSIKPPNALPDSTLESIEKTKTIKIGYEGYPPYTIKDPSTGKLTGYAVDIGNYIGEETGWKVAWIETSSDTKIPDLSTGKFDVMVEPIFETIPRATKVGFTKPYAYFGYATGIVKQGESRFEKIEDVNKNGITVAVRLGYTDQTFAVRNLPKAKKRVMNIDNINQLFLDVTSGNSDIALADMESVLAYEREHSNDVDAVFIEQPPASVGAGFMYRQGDYGFGNFLNTVIDSMQTTGLLDELDLKYKVTALRPKLVFS